MRGAAQRMGRIASACATLPSDFGRVSPTSRTDAQLPHRWPRRHVYPARTAVWRAGRPPRPLSAARRCGPRPRRAPSPPRRAAPTTSSRTSPPRRHGGPTHAARHTPRAPSQARQRRRYVTDPSKVINHRSDDPVGPNSARAGPTLANFGPSPAETGPRVCRVPAESGRSRPPCRTPSLHLLSRLPQGISPHNPWVSQPPDLRYGKGCSFPFHGSLSLPAQALMASPPHCPIDPRTYSSSTLRVFLIRKLVVRP